MPSSNILENIPAPAIDEFVETLLSHKGGKIERIVSHGHASPEEFWYDQETDEWVVLLTGSARLQFKGETDPVVLNAGDFLFIPAHRKHRVEWTDPDLDSIWLAVYFES